MSAINLSATSVPLLGLASNIGISLSAATGAILIASTIPFSPFTTEISDTFFVSSNLFANSREVSYLVLPQILSVDIFSEFNADSTDLFNEFSPPIKYTFVTPSLFNSALVLSSNLLFCVKSIGASFASAKGVAVNASAKELSFTITASLAFIHPFLLISIAVSHLPFPFNVSLDTPSAASTVVKFPSTHPATNVKVSSDAIFFGNFIILSSYKWYITPYSIVPYFYVIFCHFT